MTDAILERVRSRGTDQRWVARFAKRDNRAGTSPDWADYAGGRNGQVVTLRVTLRTEPLKGRLAKDHPVGEILSVYVVDGPKEKPGDELSEEWAEYTERSYAGNGEWLIEEWRMQLLQEVA